VRLDAPVTEVTVLEDRAQVVREGRADLPAGRVRVRVAGVSPVLADKTLALSLAGVLICSAGFYILLDFEFLAGVQVLVYVGGILVLLVFGIMLTNQINSAQISQSSVQKVLGLVVVLTVTSIMLTAMLPHDWVGSIMPLAFQDTVKGIGFLLFSDYLILFEIASVLLLGALIGAATLARKEL